MGCVYVYIGRFIFWMVSVLVIWMSVPLSAIAVSVVIFVMRSFVNTDCCCCSALKLCVVCVVSCIVGLWCAIVCWGVAVGSFIMGMCGCGVLICCLFRLCLFFDAVVGCVG